MRPVITVQGPGLTIGISKVHVVESDLEFVRIEQKANGTWEMEISANLAPTVKDRLKEISFHQLHREHQTCYTVWRGTGRIVALKPGYVLTDHRKVGGYIAMTRNADGAWWFQTCPAADQNYKARDIESIHFDWSTYPA